MRHSPPMTPERAAIIKYLVNHAGLLQHQAAAKVDVNQGRVSEVIRGKRFADIPPAKPSDLPPGMI